MKKITLTLAMASMIAATSMATEPTNLIQNGNFEEEMPYAAAENHTISGGLFVPRVTNLPETTSQLTAPQYNEAKDSSITITKGMWIKKCSAIAYAKAYVTKDPENAANNVFGMNFDTKTGVVQTSLNNFYQFQVGQKLTTNLDKTKKYVLSYKAKQNNLRADGASNFCTIVSPAIWQIAGAETMRLADTLAVTADWQTYTTTFNLANLSNAAFTAEDMILTFSIKTNVTDANELGKNGDCVYSGIFFDDISLTEVLPTSVSTTEKANAQVTGQAGSVRIVSEAGANVTLYTLSGTLVSNTVLNSNEASMDAKAGMYLVKVDNMTYKTIVK